MDSRDVFAILNPLAGQARVPATADEIARLLAAQGLRPALHLTTGPGDAQTAATEALQRGFERVAVAGGDGTISEVTGALAGTGAAMGVIPLGTGNALGRELGLPLGDLPAACRIIAEGHTRRIDVGVCNGTAFAIMCSVGFDAEVAFGAHQGAWKTVLGKWAFVTQFFLKLSRASPRHFRVTVDDRSIEERLWAVAICNGSQYTWRLRFAPDARLDDGGLHVVLFHKRGRLPLAYDVSRHWLSHGMRLLSDTTTLRAHTIRVEVDPPVRWQTDGDVRGMSPIEVAVHPQALRLIVADQPG